MAANPILENAGSLRSTSDTGFSKTSSLSAARTVFVRWWRTSETRRHLSRLDDRLLLDLGFDPHEARREANKPFWKPFTLTRSSLR